MAERSQSDHFDTSEVYSFFTFADKKPAHRGFVGRLPRVNAAMLDNLDAFARLVREGTTRKQLWTAYPDERWRRDPRQPHSWPSNAERKAGEKESSVRSIEFICRRATAKFHFLVGSKELERVTVRLEPVLYTNQNSDQARVLWRNLRSHIGRDFQFTSRRELVGMLTMGGEFKGCDLVVQFGWSKTPIDLEVRLQRIARDEQTASIEPFAVYR